MTQHSSESRYSMFSLLGAALVQGGGLYAVQHVLKRVPAGGIAPAWIGAALALMVLLPLAAQLISGHLRQQRAWMALAVLSLLMSAFGWQQFAGTVQQHATSTIWPTAVLLSLALPFVQTWLQTNRWWPTYPDLFLIAWRNHLLLAQAALFLGLFWGLLSLAVALFSFIDFDQPRRFIFSPGFVSFVSPLVFAAGLHLSAHSPRRTTTLLELVLTPLRWLALLAGAILLAFTPLLLIRLPDMLGSGERIISAYALLSLVCATVLFINAAFREGRSAAAFPKPIAASLRAVTPLMLVIALVALYAMYLRVDAYGLTVSRIWGLMAASTAVLYGIGYTIAALRRGPWMAGIAVSNTVIAVFVIVMLGLMYTPALSPQRLAAESQFQRVLRTPLDDLHLMTSPIYTLAHSTGRHGRQKLQALTDLQDHPDAPDIRQLAADLLSGMRLNPGVPSRHAIRLANLPIHPAGQTLTPAEAEQISQHLLDRGLMMSIQPLRGGLFIDLDEDGVQEFVLLHDSGALLYERSEAGWRFVATMYATQPAAAAESISAALTQGEVRLRRPRWAGIELAGTRLEVLPWDGPPAFSTAPAAPTLD